MKEFTIALAGNPNAGKSTVFNTLTGSHQHVGNWPGKTVEKKEGLFFHNGLTFNVVDLPGTYSLSAYSLEEQIARDFVIKSKPALVVNVIDAANLERNLYLTAQILETGTPLIVVLNMMDVARSRGFQIDTRAMSECLGGIPVLSTVARRNEGLTALKDAIAAAVLPPATPKDRPLQQPLAELTQPAGN
jgi:ferrous iron transport protein B